MKDLLTRIESLADSQIKKFEEAALGDWAISLDDTRKLDILADLVMRLRKAEKPADDPDNKKTVAELEEELRRLRGR